MGSPPSSGGGGLIRGRKGVPRKSRRVAQIDIKQTKTVTCARTMVLLARRKKTWLQHLDKLEKEGNRIFIL